MIPPSTAETMGKLLGGLYVQPGITGACLQIGESLVVHDLPYSDDRVTSLAVRINNLIDGYEGVGRGIWQICAGFENFRLLILCHSQLRLSLLLHPDTDPALAGGRGMHLLMEAKSLLPSGSAQTPTQAPAADLVPHAAVAGTPGIDRKDFEKLLSSLLSRVAASNQASKLIQRELDVQKINGSTMLDPKDARRIGLYILEQIPNRGKRAALCSEFLNALNK